MPPRRLRLDAELVRRGLARSREHASELIAAGRVSVNKAVATKPATGVDHRRRPRRAVPTRTARTTPAAGRTSSPARWPRSTPLGLQVDGSSLPGRRRLDRRLHRRAAARRARARWWRSTSATASWSGRLRNDPRVRVHDRTNIREIDTELIGGPVDLVVGDLSFISLELVLDALIGVTAPDGDLVLMVKPQFEVGKERLGKGGVVRDLGAPRGRRRRAWPQAAASRGWGARAVTASPLPGPSGNVEFFLWLRAGDAAVDRDAIEAEVARSADLGAAGEKVNP